MNGWQIVLAAVAAFLVVGVAIGMVSPRHCVRGPFRVLLPILYRRKVVGLENLPAEKGCVVVCNHVSYIDGILILWMLPRNVRWVVDAGNFRHSVSEVLG